MAKIKPVFSFGTALLLGLLFYIKNIQADYIYLKDGSVISGVLTEEKEKLLIYRTTLGEMFINRENIDRIVPENKDKPLLREAEIHLKNRKFKPAIKACGEALEINPNNIEAMELKEKAITEWRNYEAGQEEKIRNAQEKAAQEASSVKKMEETLKTKWGIAIKKDGTNYIISDVFYNCPLSTGEIKPYDTLISIQNTAAANISLNKLYDLLLTLKKFELLIHRQVILTREKITWQSNKEYVGLGISIEKIDIGIKITNIMKNGPAAKAGLLNGDIIIELGGRSLNVSMDKAVEMLKGNAGTKLNAVIERKIILQ